MLVLCHGIIAIMQIDDYYYMRVKLPPLSDALLKLEVASTIS